MNKKRVIGIVSAVGACGILALVGTMLSDKKGAVVLDQSGNQIAELVVEDGTLSYECEGGYSAYLDIVRQEVLKEVQNHESVDEEKAAKLIADSDTTIETWFDKETFDAVIESYDSGNGMGYERFGVAVSDKEGHLTACYSNTRGDDSYNNVTMPTFAGSTMKPLSVYGPAVEAGDVCWSTMYEDSAYSMITNEDGIAEAWPQNVTPFTGKEITIADAVKESNNAVAVKVLKDYGVEKSVRFLKDTLGYKVDNEEKLLKDENDERILSNIALGYLEEGVTVAKMADAYQVFINEGVDTPLCTVKEMKKSGETYWKPQQAETKVFSKETAYIMNRMLREVVTDGTGLSAQAEGLDVCGKTGTSDYGDHWFVGMIPENVCAIWYKSDEEIGGDTADAARICKDIFEKIGKAEYQDADYIVPEDVIEAKYCRQSGLLAGDQCKETKVGYYAEETLPEICGKCR